MGFPFCRGVALHCILPKSPYGFMCKQYPIVPENPSQGESRVRVEIHQAIRSCVRKRSCPNILAVAKQNLYMHKTRRNTTITFIAQILSLLAFAPDVRKRLGPSTNLPRSASLAPRAISLHSSAGLSRSILRISWASATSSVPPCLRGEILLFAIPLIPPPSPRRRLHSAGVRRQSPREDVFAGTGAAPYAGCPCRCRGRYARA